MNSLSSPKWVAPFAVLLFAAAGCTTAKVVSSSGAPTIQ